LAAILDLAVGDIDHELRDLGGVARTLEALIWHDVSMRDMPSDSQRHRWLPYLKEFTTLGRGRVS
jgi:hypothetical protein